MFELTFAKVKKEHIKLNNELYQLKALRLTKGKKDLDKRVRIILEDLTFVLNTYIDLKGEEIDFITEKLKFWKKLQESLGLELK